MVNSQKVCSCRRGYAGRFDGKCAHCRTKRERELHRLWVYRGCPDVTSNVPIWEWPKVETTELTDEY